MKEKVYLLRCTADIAKLSGNLEHAINAGFDAVDLASETYLYSNREKQILSDTKLNKYRRYFFILAQENTNEKEDPTPMHFDIPDTYKMRFSISF